jgi:hypothetical protein
MSLGSGCLQAGRVFWKTWLWGENLIETMHLREGQLIINHEMKKYATDLHIFLHKAERFLPQASTVDDFVSAVFGSFEQKPRFLSNDEAEEMLAELWAAHKDGRRA